MVKLTFSGQPSPRSAAEAAPPPAGRRIANVTSGLVLDSGGNVASGSALKQWNYDGSTNLQWQLVDLGSGYYRIVNRTNGMVADSWGNTANGASCLQAAWNGGNNQQWRLNSVGNGRYQIINRGTGTALDGAGSTTAGATTVLWAPNSQHQQPVDHHRRLTGPHVATRRPRMNSRHDDEEVSDQARAQALRPGRRRGARGGRGALRDDAGRGGDDAARAGRGARAATSAPP